MPYYYCLNTSKSDENVIGGIANLMMRQARISTRRRSDRWELKVHADEISIRFRHKYDRDDFLEVFEAGAQQFLVPHGLGFGGNANADLRERAERSLLPYHPRQKR